MKSTSIKRTGSASNLLSAAATYEDKESSSLGNVLNKSTLPSFTGVIKRTGSATNLSGNNFGSETRSNNNRKTSELISSLSKSGVMMFVDDKNFCQSNSSSIMSNTIQNTKSLNPAQFFKGKRSSSTSRCTRKRKFEGASSFLRRTPSADRPSQVRPHSSPSHSSLDSASPQDNNLVDFEKSRSLPQSPQHSPPRKVPALF